MTMTPRTRATSADGARPAASGRGRRLDPDRLAALEEERDHLARSLRDLETERDAGDLAEEDYLALRDDYVVRTAAVLRALEEQRELRNSGPRAPLARRLLVGGGVVVFALGAGLLVARLAGIRTSNEGLTGDVRGSVRDELAGCLELAGGAFRATPAGDAGSGSDQLLDAVKCYSEVLDRAPNNPEALTYRGWLLVRTGNAALEQQAARDLDEAVTADPTYPDARAFRAIVFFRLGRFQAAQDELDVLDTLERPPIIDSLLAQFGVREGVAAGLAGEQPATGAGG